jgi:hypothetical protein
MEEVYGIHWGLQRQDGMIQVRVLGPRGAILNEAWAPSGLTKAEVEQGLIKAGWIPRNVKIIHLGRNCPST